MKSTQKDYTKYRIERAWKTFEDAKSLDRIPLIAQISNLKSQKIIQSTELKGPGKHLRMQNPWQNLRAGTHQ